MNNHENFFQFRFIDKNGKENIRVERDNKKVFSVKDDELQNKSNRYYFKETIKKNTDNFWYSSLDLNYENDKIEKPIRPTFRVSKNVFLKGEFYGILIVNIDMTYLLNYISTNNEFNIYLVDKDGYFLINPNNIKSWSRYFDKRYTIYSEFEGLRQEQFNSNINGKNIFIVSLNKYFKNKEDIKLIMKIKDKYYKSLSKNNIKSLNTIGAIVFTISIIVGLLISVPTSKLHLDFNNLLKDNLKYLDIIDEYVIIMKVDISKKIVHVSKELCRVSGYNRDELIGQNPSTFKSGQMKEEIYKNLWNKITNGQVWIGDLENKSKNGNFFWLKTTIIPNYTDNNIDSYTSVSENITDKKIIEKISETDKLTQLYNRIKLDNTLEAEMERYYRYKHKFSLILIDIDHFKSVNDIYGHLVGDKVLIELSNLLKEHIRKTDIVGRWGGEEFMIICKDTSIKGAIQLSENIRNIIREFKFNIVKQKTISVGVTEIKDNDNLETLIKRVDEYLYKSKENGRDMVTSDLIKRDY